MTPSKTLYFLIISLAISYCILTLPAYGAEPPPLQLANIYNDNINPQNYWVSEKLDGVRAYWDGRKLISRQGNVINSPGWFVKNFPAEALDGELWIGHNQFERVSKIIRQVKPNDSAWKEIRYMVFDLPKDPGIFNERLLRLQQQVAYAHSEYLQWIPQYKIENHQQLMQQLNGIVKQGGEGLMLHRGESYYQAVRNDDLLKVKAYQDAEAIVIAQILGKGKYQNMLGALLVENEAKIRFKIGSGFSDEQRKHPPPIGSLITYKYFGTTKNGIPRFASFIRVRDDILPGDGS